MRNSMTKEEKEIQDIITNLCKKSLDHSTNKTQIFFRLAPHVKLVNIEVYKNGWKSEGDCDFRINIFYNQELSIIKAQEKMFLEYLESIPE